MKTCLSQTTVISYLITLLRENVLIRWNVKSVQIKSCGITKRTCKIKIECYLPSQEILEIIEGRGVKWLTNHNENCLTKKEKKKRKTGLPCSSKYILFVTDIK